MVDIKSTKIVSQRHDHTDSLIAFCSNPFFNIHNTHTHIRCGDGKEIFFIEIVYEPNEFATLKAWNRYVGWLAYQRTVNLSLLLVNREIITEIN